MKKLLSTILLISFLIIAAKPRSSIGYNNKITGYYAAPDEIFRRDASSSTGWEWKDGSGVWADMALAGGTGIVNLSGGAASNVSYIGKVFTNPSGAGNGHALTLAGGNNIWVEKCLFMSTDGLAIYLNTSTNITIKQNFITNCKRGILIQDCDAGNIKIHANQFANMVWDRLEGGDIAGQYLQISITANAPNVEVTSNRGENFFGECYNEDLMNFFTSGGTVGDPFLIKGNICRGGNWSMSGGGFVGGDVGGSNLTFDSNYLVNPGRYGFQTAGGSNMTWTNNKLFADQLVWNAIGFYIVNCSGVTVGTSNWSNYKNSAGSDANYSTSACGSPTGPSTGQTLASMNIPDPLLSYMSEDDLWYLRSVKWDYTSLVANGDFVRSPSTQDGSTTCNVRRPTAAAGSDQSITISTATLSGSGTPHTGGAGSNTIAGYHWVQASGPNTATMSASTSSTNNLSGLITGTYVFRFEVAQNNGQHNYDTFHADWVTVVVSSVTSTRYTGRIF